MKRLIEALQVIAGELNHYFHFADESQSNIEADFAKLPCIFFYLTRFSDNAVATNLFGTKDRTYFARIEVLNKSQLDFTDTERLDIFERTEKTLTSLIYSLRHVRTTNDNPVISDIVSIQGSFVKNKYDANLDGVACDFAFKLPIIQNEICPKDYEILD